MKTRDMQGMSVLQKVWPSETLAGVAGKMTEYGVSALPIVDDNCRVVGMISERDLLTRIEQSPKTQGLKSVQSPLAPLTAESSTQYLNSWAQFSLNVGKTKVEEATTRAVVLADEEDCLGALVQRLTERNINDIPVVKDETCRTAGCVVRIVYPCER